MKFTTKRSIRTQATLLISILALSNLTACLNIFDPVDNPSNMAQYLSAARACFDKGDLGCAREYYGKMGASHEVATLESAFVSLEGVGAGMEAFIRSFGDGSGGNGLTKLANALSSGAGTSKRDTIFQAYRSVASLSDPALRGFGKFITALTLAAELLAEASGGDGVVAQADLAASPSGCLAAVGANCNTVNMSNAAYAGSLSTDTSLTTYTYSLKLLNAALNEVSNGLTAMSATGKFSTGTGGFAQTLTAAGSLLGTAANDAASRTYIQLLLQQGVGQ